LQTASYGCLMGACLRFIKLTLNNMALVGGKKYGGSSKKGIIKDPSFKAKSGLKKTSMTAKKSGGSMKNVLGKVSGKKKGVMKKA